MKTTCTTHFHACDCREEKFKLLEQRLKEAEEALKTILDTEDFIPERSKSLAGTVVYNTGYLRQVARAYFEKYGEKEEV